MTIFDEEVADNVEEELFDEIEEEPEQPTPPVEQPVDQTKAFAARLKEEKQKAKKEAMEEIAQSFGYESWEEYRDAQTNNKLEDNGLDPDTIKPLLKDLIKNDPDYLEAMRYKAEKEELEKELFAKNALTELNQKYGTNFKDVNELDADTVKLWNQGTPLVKAFAANNVSLILENAMKKQQPRDSGKSHLKNVDTSTLEEKDVTPTEDEMRRFKLFGFTEEQVKEFRKRRNK